LLETIKTQIDIEHSKTRYWVKRMFLEIQIGSLQVLNNDFFSILWDINEWLGLRHSMCGFHQTGVADVMLLSFLRRYMGISKTEDLSDLF